MKQYVILADSACDLSEEIRKRFGIETYLPGYVTVDGREMRAELNWNTLSRETFYKKLGNKNCKITTAPPSLQEYCDAFAAYAEKGISVLSISLSSGISGTYNLTRLAAEEVKNQYPGAEIRCVDSFRMSGGFGLLVCHAARLRSEGKTLDETVQWLEENKTRVHQMGPVDGLMFLARRGQITMGKAVMGTFAGIKPMCECNAVGYTTVLTRAKGMKKALETTVRYVEETAEDIENQFIIVSQANREHHANLLKDLLRARLNPKEIFVCDAFPSCGTNVGPGMAAVYYLGSPISEDLSAEGKAMEKALEN